MAKELNVTDLRKGDRVVLDYGCMHGSEEATVAGVESTRWGYHAVVTKDDGSEETLHGAETLRGIGWRKVAA